MRLGQTVTHLIGKGWVPVSIKRWWYSEPPEFNDFRVLYWINIALIVAVVIAAALYIFTVF